MERGRVAGLVIAIHACFQLAHARSSLQNAKSATECRCFDPKKKAHASTLPQEDKFRRVRRLFLDNDVDNSGELGRQELDVAFIHGTGLRFDRSTV